MKTKGFVSFLFMLGWLLVAGCGNTDNAQQQISFTSLQKGSYSSIGNNTEQVSVIRNNADWDYFWQQLYASSSPKPNLPPINFSENYIVAVVDAPRSSSGYSITITSITFIQHSSAGITVHAQQLSPGQSCPGLAVNTQPFHIVIVPIYQGEATLALSQSVLNCGP